MTDCQSLTSLNLDRFAPSSWYFADYLEHDRFMGLSCIHNGRLWESVFTAPINEECLDFGGKIADNWQNWFHSAKPQLLAPCIRKQHCCSPWNCVFWQEYSSASKQCTQFIQPSLLLPFCYKTLFVSLFSSHDQNNFLAGDFFNYNDLTSRIAFSASVSCSSVTRYFNCTQYLSTRLSS